MKVKLTSTIIAALSMLVCESQGALITTTNIQDGAVTTPKLANSAVTTLKLATNAVRTSNLTNGAVTNVKLATNAVGNPNLQTASVTAGKIASGQVVKSINLAKDNVALVGGKNVTVATSGNTISVSAIAGVPNMKVYYTNGTFTVPQGVTRIMVELWGAGGGGGMGTNSYDQQGRLLTGGGGGGGEYAKGTVTVTPGTAYSVTVGKGGSGAVVQGANGANGQSSSFANLVTASGGFYGKGAPDYSGGFGGGGNVNPNSQIHRVSGSSGQTYYDGKSGGSAACGGFAYGGNSGGTPGAEPGGGGNGDGGRGANGRVIVYY